MILTTAGSGIVRIGDLEFTTTPGELTFWKPNVYQNYSTAALWGQCWAHFLPYPHWDELLDYEPFVPGILRAKVKDWNELVPLFDQLCEGTRKRVEVTPRESMHRLEGILIKCQKGSSCLRLSPEQAVARDQRVERVIEEVYARMHEPLSLTSLATIIGVSESRLAHMFKDSEGVTLGDFIELVRIKRACRLLESTDQSVKSISEEIGFQSPYYFSLRFKLRTGWNPTDYRRLCVEFIASQGLTGIRQTGRA